MNDKIHELWDMYQLAVSGVRIRRKALERAIGSGVSRELALTELEDARDVARDWREKLCSELRRARLEHLARGLCQ